MTNENDQPTIELGQFWRWLKQHRNCIIQAGGPGFTLFDTPDIFWYLSEEGEIFIAQLIRGKEILGELVFPPGEVLFVQSHPDEGDQTMFDCIAKGPDGPATMLWFLLAHPFDEVPEQEGRWTH